MKGGGRRGGGGGWQKARQKRKLGRRRQRGDRYGSIKSSSLRDNSSRETGEEGGLWCMQEWRQKKGRAEIEEIRTWTKSLTREREWREQNTGGYGFVYRPKGCGERSINSSRSSSPSPLYTWVCRLILRHCHRLLTIEIRKNFERRGTESWLRTFKIPNSVVSR